MSVFHLTITPRDPIVVRDGRPFGDGQQKMRSLDWPYPQLLAGALRTMAGKAVGAYRPQELNAIRLRGPLPVRDNTLYLPLPADLVCDDSDLIHRSRPRSFTNGGCNLPLSTLMPCVLPNENEFKPVSLPPFWCHAEAVKWLTETSSSHFPHQATMKSPCHDQRVHTAVNPRTQSAEDSQLFSTTGLSFPDDDTLTVSVDAAGDYTTVLAGLNKTHPLGGERRLARWVETNAASAVLWSCPKQIRDLFTASPAPKRIRMTLATPAIWRGGWLPEWALTGNPVPGTNVVLRLVGACVPRFRPISGWSLEANRRGPKPVRWMAPAGSTYFFEVVGENPPLNQLADLWLQPIADSTDETQDQRDGFGLATWGIWKEHEGR